jgi:hypothetical protein
VQDAQRGQPSHPPDPGAPRRALSAGKSAAPRLTLVSRFTVPGSEARTPLADFFSILLNVADGRGRKQSLNQADKPIVLSV